MCDNYLHKRLKVRNSCNHANIVKTEPNYVPIISAASYTFTLHDRKHCSDFYMQCERIGH